MDAAVYKKLIDGVSVKSQNLLKVDDYSLFVDNGRYQIWKLTGTKRIAALFRDIAVRISSTSPNATIEISENGINGSYSNSVVFNSTNFPALLSSSYIERILVVPWSRGATTATSQHAAREWRMVMITSKGQIYHNFPSRAVGGDGTAVEGDVTKFEESAVWDLAERKYPSLNSSATGVERYMPGLPSDRYDYHPMLNTNAGFVDTYGNGGFGNSITKDTITYPRFYQPGRDPNSNAFSFMGGYEPDDKIQIIGTYRNNTSVAVRTCLFASDDGGRNWFCKYEFTTQTALQYTAINTASITENYVENSFKINKRTLVVPSSSDKEPITKFTWESDVVVAGITKGSTTTITTATAHGLSSGAIVAFKTNTGACAGWDWLLNDTVSTTSGGNGVLFGVKVINTTTLELYEYPASAHNNIPARHIHYVNRVKDGWLFGTGETYPEGFVFYMQMKNADSYSNLLAYQNFLIVRITSTASSVQRLLGADMRDDADTTMLVALDSETITRPNVTMPDGRTDVFSRSSTGIYKGKLVDVDDMSKFTPVFEAKQPAYLFKRKCGAYIFCGQRGEFAISFDGGATWIEEDLGEVIQHFYGESKKMILADNFVLILKV